MLPTRTLAALLAAFTVVAAAPAAASFHLMRIVQVHGGDEDHPDAQYVVLQMCVAGQNFVGGHTVGFFAADGSPAGTVTFPTLVPNGASQAKILIATSTAELAFGLAADLRTSAAIDPVGGKVCFDPGLAPIDCFAWGSYSALPDPTVGNPFDPLNPLSGDAAFRDLSIAGDPMTLDCVVPNFDDTDDSAADFDANSPAPGNNAGVTGSVPPELVFVHGFEAGSASGWSAEVPG
jgi:hypothetical protein